MNKYVNTCKGWRYITIPHIENYHNAISPELYKVLKFNRYGNTCGHTKPIPVKYKVEYLHLLIDRFWKFQGIIIDKYCDFAISLENHCKFIYCIFEVITIIIRIICIPLTIIRKILEELLILYYKNLYKKTAGMYFSDCRLLRKHHFVGFDKEDL